MKLKNILKTSALSCLLIANAGCSVLGRPKEWEEMIKETPSGIYRSLWSNSYNYHNLNNFKEKNPYSKPLNSSAQIVLPQKYQLPEL